jgi:hypothetical protein
MARNDPQVNLRMPAELKDRLDQAAETSKRSLTAEIIARLEMTFKSGSRPPFEDVLLRLIESKTGNVELDGLSFDMTINVTPKAQKKPES